MKDDQEDDKERRVIVVVAILIALVIFVLALIFPAGSRSSPKDTLNAFLAGLIVWLLGGLLAFGLLAGIVYFIRRGK